MITGGLSFNGRNLAHQFVELGPLGAREFSQERELR
jgi:hypothetical protein